MTAASLPVTLFTGQWIDLSLAEVAELAAKWGYDGLEIACSGEHLDVWRAADVRTPGNPRWRKLPVAAIVTVWWVLWASSLLLIRATTYDTEVARLDTLVIMDAIAGTIGLLCVLVPHLQRLSPQALSVQSVSRPCL